MSPPSMPIVNSEAASISSKIVVISMIVLFFILAFCFFLSLYAKWYWSRTEDPSIVSWRRRTARQQGPPAQVATRRRGLDRATLRSLPVLVYEAKDFKGGLECSVCLSEISLGEKLRLLPNCNHGFHVECIDMWFKSHSTCPLCRDFVSSSQTQSIDSNQELQVVGATRALSDSNSDSDSESDDNHEDGTHDSMVNSGEAPSFPTNVLFWGNEVQVRSFGKTTNEFVGSQSTSFSSNSGVTSQRNELVIEIPRDLCEDCSSSRPSRTGFVEEEAKTPVVSRLRSLRRLLSRGKNSADVEPV